ncbi:MAG: peptidoglycan editing factor PgeF [Alphaproteobacteria bacterium]|nr:MAG: hypothetical protein B6I23_02220 [Rickettsiaceae bacterium 4572_127]
MKQFDSFRNIKGIAHGVFDRSDVPKGEYSREWFQVEFGKICAKKLGFENAAFPKQKHTSDVVIATEKFENILPIADAVVTNKTGLMIGVQTADCSPILFCDPMKKIIGACHAGWKGANEKVIENTIEKMVKLGAKKQNILVGIGAMISQSSYEIDEPVYSQVKDKKFFQNIKKGKWLFDLRGLIIEKLKQNGIEKIEVSERNTYTDSDCFSYREATHKFSNLPVKKRLNGKRIYTIIGIKSP